MSTLGDKFREAARDIIYKFSTDEHELHHIVSESYDTNAGMVTRDEVIVPLPAARYELSDDKRRNLPYSEDTCIVAVAGLDLGAVVPKVGDLVTFPNSTLRHRVVWVVPDQYGAAYFLHVAETADGS